MVELVLAVLQQYYTRSGGTHDGSSNDAGDCIVIWWRCYWWEHWYCVVDNSDIFHMVGELV